MIYQASIETVFSAAHALRLPDGSLEPTHGHDFRLTATVQSDQLDAMDTVMDFHDLEKIVESVVGPWRNQCLNETPPFAGGGDDGSGLAINPSAERIAQHVATSVAAELPSRVKLYEVSVTEAAGCVARVRY